MKNYIKIIVFGLFLFLIGIIILQVETMSYHYSNDMPTNFQYEEHELKVLIGKNYNLEIDNEFEGKNIVFYIDNTLDGEVKIVTKELETGDAHYTQQFVPEENLIRFQVRNSFHFGNMYDIFKLAYSMVKDKTIYNYTLLKYPKIEAYVNEKDKERIQIIKNEKQSVPAYETNN